MRILKIIFRKIKNRFNYYYYKNKKFNNENDFYTYLFTKNTSWNSAQPNEDETIRWQALKTEIEKINIHNKLNFDILEIGCGRGWLSQKLSTYGNVTGVEPIENVVNYAKKLFPTILFFAENQATFLQKFPNKKYNLIISSEVIEHVTNKSQFISDTYNLLKLNGILILTTPRLEYYNYFVEAFKQNPNQPTEDWLSENQLRTLFAQANFKILNTAFFAPLPNISENILITQLWAVQKIS